MKKLSKLLIFLLVFSLFFPLAASIRNLDLAQKTHIGVFEEISPDLHLGQNLYLTETQQGCNDFCQYDAHRPLYVWYFRARYFSDELGRFISRDPLGYDGGGYSLYAGYFAQIFLMDPSGLIPAPYGYNPSTGMPIGGGNPNANSGGNQQANSSSGGLSKSYNKIMLEEKDNHRAKTGRTREDYYMERLYHSVTCQCTERKVTDYFYEVEDRFTLEKHLITFHASYTTSVTNQLANSWYVTFSGLIPIYGDALSIVAKLTAEFTDTEEIDFTIDSNLLSSRLVADVDSRKFVKDLYKSGHEGSWSNVNLSEAECVDSSVTTGSIQQ